MKRILLIASLALLSATAFPQSFAKAERALVAVYSKISNTATEEDNVKNNKRFIAMLDSVLKKPASFHYPFNELKIGNVTAPDQTFRIFTWFIVHTSGEYETFGMLQRYYKESNTVEVFRLEDCATAMRDPTMASCTPKYWFGATYYDLREFKYEDTKTYVLLGWRPNNIYTQKKVIETFRFDKKGKPAFGHQIVEQKGKGYKKRVVFEYSSKQTMMLRYEKKKKMYVLDHIAPSDPRYEGIYDFYGPDFSIDGYRFKQGKLRYVADIDLHSPRQKFSDYIPEKWKSKKNAKEKEKRLGL